MLPVGGEAEGGFTRTGERDEDVTLRVQHRSAVLQAGHLILVVLLTLPLGALTVFFTTPSNMWKLRLLGGILSCCVLGFFLASDVVNAYLLVDGIISYFGLFTLAYVRLCGCHI